MATKQPPPLMKKHSQTDLVSRLKTRKILGVGGEDDDGEVHRSKISQVLGNEIKFAVKEPLGLRVWQFVTAVMFSGVAIMALAFPEQLYDAVFEEESVNSKTPIRLYGGALLSECIAAWLTDCSSRDDSWVHATEVGLYFLGWGLCPATTIRPVHFHGAGVKYGVTTSSPLKR
uniref:Tumor protein p53-inducible protein 11 n=1 Tax=Podarcis muralis TaxID=64176 RepID=A0A670JGD4_PODMU